MKLPNQTHGPVTLSSIDYAANLSEETMAFTAMISIGSHKSRVSNEGRGGSNWIQDNSTQTAVSEYARTLPDEQDEHGSLKMNDDFLISIMVENALQERDDAKYKKKGFTFRITSPQGTFYANVQPTPEMIRKAKLDPAQAKIVSLV